VTGTVGSAVGGLVDKSECGDLPAIMERLFAAVRCTVGARRMACGGEPVSDAAPVSRDAAQPVPRQAAQPVEWDEARWREYAGDYGVAAMIALATRSLHDLVGVALPVSERRAEEGFPPSAHRVVREIEDIIAREVASDLTVTEIAKRVFVSANYASRLFKQSTGRTITEAMILARVERAKELLAERSPIKAFQVGELVGYPDPVYFTKLFKRFVGMTPKQFREVNLISASFPKKLG